MTPPDRSFEEDYLKVRELEHWVYADEAVAQLPFASQEDTHFNLWKIRTKSMNRFLAYPKVKTAQNILDLGCGNGWFAHRISEKTQAHVFALDINLLELEQGARVFKDQSIDFVHADVFKAHLPTNFFDLVVLNGLIQYFPSIPELFDRLFELINSDGEIHIIDSPFYQVEEVAKARERTKEYYQKMGVEAMSEQYHHHSWEAIMAFNPKKLYVPPSKWWAKLRREKDSPFCWLCVKK